MVIINNASKIKINDINLDNFYVVLDFDKTLSTKDSNTTFSLFSKSGFYSEDYTKERDKNYKYFRPLELDPTISSSEKYQIMQKWQEASYKLMLKYRVRESDIKKILANPNLLELREGAIRFIKLLNENHIPFIINSAGCGNFIVELLRLNNCYSDNAYVYSNMLEFEDDVIVDSITDIIHSMNKFDIKLDGHFKEKISNKKYAIIIGDQLSDLDMAKALPKEDILSFGFLESNVSEVEALFNERFDVVLKDNEGFDSISKILKLRK